MSELAPRVSVATYWWIASEILRRNPALDLLETYPLDGFYDCLTLRGHAGSRPVNIDFNRIGSIHVHPDHIGHLNELAALSHQDAHWAVKEIERIAGLKPPESAPASNGRTLTFRLIARVLNYAINDRASWDVRMLDEDGLGLALNAPTQQDQLGGIHPFPTIFPTGEEYGAFRVASGPLALGRFWVLLRDASPVAIFDTKGVVHTRTSRVALRPLYARMNRNLTQTMAQALGDLLP